MFEIGSVAVRLAVPTVFTLNGRFDDAGARVIDESDVKTLTRVDAGSEVSAFAKLRRTGRSLGEGRPRPHMPRDGVTDERSQLLLIH